MEQYCTKLSRGHVEGANHWLLQEKPKECVNILSNWIIEKVLKNDDTSTKQSKL